jgi:tyrosinase
LIRLSFCHFHFVILQTSRTTATLIDHFIHYFQEIYTHFCTMMLTYYFKALAAVLLSISMMMMLTVDMSPVAAQGRGSTIQLNSCPNGIRPRREIRTLSTGERDAYINAIKEMQKGSRPTRYDEFAQLHNNAREYAHNHALFFPWHRYFIALYERELQKTNKDVMLPYWDWSIDSQAPSMSIVFRPDYFGGNGRDGDHCLRDGPFADMTVYYPRPGCLVRDFDQYPGTINQFYSPEALQAIINQARTYDDFRSQIEGAPHGIVHTGIGGTMSTMYSPNDPIFFMHHSMLDKQWMRWQRAYPELAHTYNGPSLANPRGATPDDVMRPWSDVRVRDVFDTRVLCYTYDDLTADDVTNTGSGESGTDNQRTPSSENSDETAKIDQPWRRSFEIISGADMWNWNRQPRNRSNRRRFGRRAETVTPPTNATTPAPADNGTIDKAQDGKTFSLTKTAIPVPLPDEWIVINGYKKETIRRDEEIIREIYYRINAIPDYVSPCALGNRADQLAQLLAAGHTSFVATGTVTNAPIPVAIPANITGPEVDPRKAAIELRKVTATIVEKDTMNSTAAAIAANNAKMVESRLIAVIGDSKSAGIQQGSLLDLNTASKENWAAAWKKALPYWSSNTTVSMTVNGNRTTTRTETKTEGHSDNASFEAQSFNESFKETS